MTGSSNVIFCSPSESWCKMGIGPAARELVEEFYKRLGVGHYDVIVLLSSRFSGDTVEIMDLYDGWYAVIRGNCLLCKDVVVDEILDRLPFCDMHEEPIIHYGEVVVFVETENGYKRFGECASLTRCREVVKEAVEYAAYVA